MGVDNYQDTNTTKFSYTEMRADYGDPQGMGDSRALLSNPTYQRIQQDKHHYLKNQLYTGIQRQFLNIRQQHREKQLSRL